VKVIYIAGPYRATNPDGSPDMFRVQWNVMEAMTQALEVWRRGAIALCPHANTMFFTGAESLPDAVWLEGDLELLRRCDAVLTTPRWRFSEGAKAEVRFAVENGIPVFHDLLQLEEWLAK
jgi:nucleoside 2-deoxyribosyltransferase